MGELPVTVVTGFLGAGKTTLLAGLLSATHGQRIGIILNELGEAGIDEPVALSRFLSLSQGCVCCLRNPELIAALEEMHARGDVDRVLLETTGVADPLALTWTLARPELRGKARLDAVLTVVDPTTFAAVQGTAEWEAQVRSADIVVLAKLDIALPDQVEAARSAVRARNPLARIVRAGEVPAGVVLDVDEPVALRLPVREHGVHSEFGVVSVSGGRYRLDPLEDLLEALPDAIFRAKGIVELDDARWVAFHVVGGRLDVRLGVPAPEHGETRMGFFGKSLERDWIESLLAPARS